MEFPVYLSKFDKVTDKAIYGKIECKEDRIIILQATQRLGDRKSDIRASDKRANATIASDKMACEEGARNIEGRFTQCDIKNMPTKHQAQHNSCAN